MTGRSVIMYQLLGSSVDSAESVVNTSTTTKVAPAADSIQCVPNRYFYALRTSRISHDSSCVMLDVVPPQIRVKQGLCPSSATTQSRNRPNFDILDQKFRCELAVDFSRANVISCRHQRQEGLLVPRGFGSCRGAVGPSCSHENFLYLYSHCPFKYISITVVMSIGF